MAIGKTGTKKPRMKKSKLQDSKLIIAAIVALALVSFFLFVFLLRGFFQTETYYVLNEDIGPRVQISAEQLDPRVVSDGQAPPNALSLADVQTGGLYTQYPLRAGDIISESSVGALSDIRVGVPDSWTITSFGVSADDAVGGRITRGTHFDIIAIDNTLDEPRAFYLFNNVLALDTTVSMEGASSADAVDTEEAQSGMTEQYVVGMRPEEAAFFHMAVEEYDIRLVLSPRENEYQQPDQERIRGFFDLSEIDGNWEPIEIGTMTDNTFMPVERDENGRPVSVEDDFEENDESSISGSEGGSSDFSNNSDNDDDDADADFPDEGEFDNGGADGGLDEPTQ